MKTKKKLWYSIGALILTLVVAGTSVGITLAAISANVGSSFNISYTAKNVHANIDGWYVLGSKPGENTPLGTASDDGHMIVFDGTERDGSEKKEFSVSPNVTFEDPEDYLEFHYTIENTGENGFGLGLTLEDWNGASSFDVKFASSTRDNTTTQASFGAESGSASFGETYVYAKGKSGSVLDISVRISVNNIEKSVSAKGTFKFDLNGLAVEPPVVGDIWQNGTFHAYSLDDLLKKISGEATASTKNMGKINELAAAKTTSQTMIENSQKVASSGASANSLDAEITIELGGLKWTPVYLSQDDDGNTILTLWLDESTQLIGKTYDTNKTFLNGTSTWNSRFSPSDDTSVPYPAAMYGTSYMSAVVLNNGGGYITSQGATELTQADQNPDSAFALFTMSNLGLTQYLVTPEHVLWQKEGQSTKELIDDISYNSPNENWSNEVTDDGFYSSDYNYAHKTGNDEWKNDYLWLPSLSETGENGSQNGIWATSRNQRKNETSSWTYSWLRSGHYANADIAYYLNANGYGWSEDYVNVSYAVRPALHLNLTKAATNAA